MARLYAYQKDHLVKTAMAKRFDTKIDKLKLKLRGVIRERFAAQFSEHAETMAKLPENYFKLREWAYVYIGGRSRGNFEFDPIRAPAWCSSTLNLVSDAPIERAIGKIDDLRVAREKASRNMRQFLKNVSSVESLYKKWPEARKIHDFTASQVPSGLQLPALTTKALNEALGL